MFSPDETLISASAAPNCGVAIKRYGRNSHIWLYEPSLWPWTWRQQTNLLAWHFGPWCCITISSLVTEGSAAEEILSRWTFAGILNLFLWPWPWPQQSNPIFSQDNPLHLMMMCHQNKISLQKDQQFRYYINKSYFDYIILNYDLDLEDSKPFFLKDNLAHNDS